MGQQDVNKDMYYKENEISVVSGLSHKSQMEKNDPKMKYSVFENIDTYRTPTKWMLVWK